MCSSDLGLDLLRLAIPRRVYTNNHMDVVAVALKNVFDRRKSITRGVKIVWEAEIMRHLGAHRQTGLKIVPHEPEDARGHTQVPDDVVGRFDEPIAAVARQAVESAVGPQNDALVIGCREEDVVRFKEPLIQESRRVIKVSF